MTQSIILMVVAIWILMIPIALGFTLKGQWPQTKAEFGATELSPWLEGLFWPLASVFLLARLMLQGYLLAAGLIVRGLFRFGGWLHHFFLG